MEHGLIIQSVKAYLQTWSRFPGLLYLTIRQVHRLMRVMKLAVIGWTLEYEAIDRCAA